MKNTTYRTNRFPVSQASSRPKPPRPSLRSPAASPAPEKGNYVPPDEEMTSWSSKLHTQSRTAGTRSYCYSSPTRWRQRSGCNFRTARSAPGRSRSQSQSRRLPPTKGWPLIWKKIERSPVISLKSQHQFSCTFAIVKRGAGDYSGKKESKEKRKREFARVVSEFWNSKRVCSSSGGERDKEKKQKIL